MRLDTEFVDESSGFISMRELILEQRIKNEVEEGKTFSEDDIVAEYMSSNRERILEWYDFGKTSEVLELGGSFGAITGLLCRKCSKVTVVDNKRSHCEIIRMRWKNYGNLHVVCENPTQFRSELRYDYIVIHEIWGFIKKYNRTENSYEQFLGRLKALLKPNGRVIIIADNRFALKYFSGVPDEYSRKLFVGIDGYKNYSYIRTFSFSELKELLSKSGFATINVYYTDSDWHFADRIYTEEEMNNVELNPSYLTSNYYFVFFDLKKTYEELQRNGCAHLFADSFIIDTGKDDIQEIDLDEKKHYSSCNGFKFPFTDEADVLHYGYKSINDNTENQLEKETELIRRFIGDIYENE